MITMFTTKRIKTSNAERTILLQNENGPCALVALVNTLVFLDGPMAAYMDEKTEVSQEELATKLAQLASPESEYIEKLFHFFPLLQHGLDVNPCFNGTFAQSPELAIFKAFEVRLVHGWVLGEEELHNATMELIADSSGPLDTSADLSSLAAMSYEEWAQLHMYHKDSKELAVFVDTYPGQLTPSGLRQLRSKLQEDHPAVLFWNNHFATIVLHKGKLYTLASDQGLDHNLVVWETLESPRGAGHFVNGDFGDSVPDTSKDAILAQQLELQDRNSAAESAAKRQSQSLKKENPKRKSTCLIC